MIRTFIVMVGVLLFAAPVFGQTVGSADTIVSPTNPLLAPLVAKVAADKASSPKKFTEVASIADKVTELDKKKRGPFVPVAQAFQAMGPEMTLPLADFVLSEYQSPSLKGSARVSFLVGAFESFGHHQAIDTVPLMLSVLQVETNHYIVRAASEAVGRVGTDAHIVDLIALAGSSSDIRAGLRGCRRMACATYLSTFLKSKRTKPETLDALKAMSGVGNSWAWKTDEAKAKDDGESVRRVVAAALVREFVKAGDSVTRSAARKAIFVVDHPSTTALIDTALKTATGATATELAALKKRFENNPVR